MSKCSVCGKRFETPQALGGHRAYCGRLGLARRARGGSEGSEGSEGLLVRVGSGSSEGSEGSEGQPSLARFPTPRVQVEAARIADRVLAGGYKVDALPKIAWGRLLVAVGIGAVVAWLLYEALGDWSWRGGKSRRQLSPYKLVGGLISGLG